MKVHEWRLNKNPSAYAKFVSLEFPNEMDLELVWDTCLSSKFLLAILETSDSDTITIKRSEKSQEILVDNLSYKPHFVGLEYILIQYNKIEKKLALRLLKSMCSGMDEVRACKFLRSRVDYPFKETIRSILIH